MYSSLCAATRLKLRAPLLAVFFIVALLRDCVDPLPPSGEWRRLASNLFAAVARPMLAWPLYSLGLRIFLGNNAIGATP